LWVDTRDAYGDEHHYVFGTVTRPPIMRPHNLLTDTRDAHCDEHLVSYAAA